MVSQQAQLSFLKSLVLQNDEEASHRLWHRIQQAEQQERTSRRWTIIIASGIASWWTAVALVTQGWSWVWQQSQHPVAVGLLWIGGIAIFTLLLVGGCWLWHRTNLRRIVEDTHRFLSGWLASCEQPMPSAAISAPSERRRQCLSRCKSRRYGNCYSFVTRCAPSSRRRC